MILNYRKAIIVNTTRSNMREISTAGDCELRQKVWVFEVFKTIAETVAKP
jgi:hypothetical protein